MRIKEKLSQRDSGVSFEFFPPRTPEARLGFIETVRELRMFEPLYVSVTSGAGGTTRERTGDTLRFLQRETDLSVMAHLTCIGATKKETDEVLRDYIDIGIENILALRGDPPKNVPGFDAAKGEFAYAKDLVEFITRYHRFSIAVAVYPEGHQESESIEKDMEYTKQKIDAGADFAITQMFFDNRYYYDFMDRAAKAGVTIPVLPGIMPITDCRRVVEFATFCSATIPRDVTLKMEAFLDKPEESQKFGIDYAIRQCEDLLSNGFRYLHFYTLNRSDAVSAILKALPLPEEGGNLRSSTLLKA